MEKLIIIKHRLGKWLIFPKKVPKNQCKQKEKQIIEKNQVSKEIGEIKLMKIKYNKIISKNQGIWK